MRLPANKLMKFSSLREHIVGGQTLIHRVDAGLKTRFATAAPKGVTMVE